MQWRQLSSILSRKISTSRAKWALCRNKYKLVFQKSILFCTRNERYQTPKGGFFKFFSYFIEPSSSAAPQIPPCRRMLESSPGLLRLWILTTRLGLIHCPVYPPIKYERGSFQASWTVLIGSVKATCTNV
jgi:hypothetical protein